MERSKFVVHKIGADEWKKLYEKNAHLAVFEEYVDEEKSKLDFALLVVNKKDEMVVYMTIKEMDKYTAFIEYGGSFPNKRGSVESFPAFLACLEFLEKDYERVNFFTENKNKPMLKFGLNAGFEIIGCCYSNNKFLLEHTLEFKKETN